LFKSRQHQPRTQSKASNNADPTHRYIRVGGLPAARVARQIALAKPPQFHIINRVILIARLGQNAHAKTGQNNREYVVLNIATQENWKNDKGDYETRTEWHRIYASRNLSKFARTLQKGQLITLEGTLRYREVEVEGTTFKHRIAQVHATSMKRLSKIESADDPLDGAGDE
jgi:single-strand DNA-binding protein